MLYVVSPSLTRVDRERADSFMTGLLSQVRPPDTCVLEGDTDLAQQVTRDDIVVVCNPDPDHGRFRRPVAEFLGRALGNETDVVAYSLEAESGSCPTPLERYSPRSVPDLMGIYGYDETRFHDAGRVLGWELQARVHPTYAREQLSLFLCYAHANREVALGIDRALLGLGHHAIRDDRRPSSTPTTDHIRALLDESEVLVFVDTPAAAESEWIRAELCVALGTGIPIVWVRFAHDPGRRLPVRPADRPDLEYPTIPGTGDDFTSIAGRIVAAAFECAPTHVRRVENCIHRFGRLGATVNELDGRQRAFELTHARPRRRHEGPIYDVVQLYGRRPTRDDRAAFRDFLEERGYLRTGSGPRPDLVAMVSPVAGSSTSGDDPPIVMHSSEYVAARSDASPNDAVSPDALPELLLFASFASTQSRGQSIRDAVHEVATLWLSRGGRICFGGHPTVTPTIDYVAQRIVPGEESLRVTIFQSEYFVTPELLEEYAAKGTVVSTPNTGVRAESLTLMRQEMIDRDAVAAVVIGGLTRDDLPPHRRGELPGVEEEMLLAQDRGIPVYLLGEPGGQAAVLAAQARVTSPAWRTLGNPLSADDNDDLATTNDYWGAAEIIWDASLRRDST